jgi:hypothetical protein
MWTEAKIAKIAKIACLNPAEGVDVRLLCLLCLA